MNYNLDHNVENQKEAANNAPDKAALAPVKSREDRVRDALSGAEFIRNERKAVNEYGTSTQNSEGGDVLSQKYRYAEEVIMPQLVMPSEKMVSKINEVLAQVAAAEKSLFGAKGKAVKAVEEGLLLVKQAGEELVAEESKITAQLTARYDAIHREGNEKLNIRLAKDDRLSAEGQAEARAAAQETFSHKSPVDTQDGVKSGFDVRDPAIVVHRARLKAGLNQALAKLQQTAEKFGVSIE